jgi:hypothetical protein
MKLYKLIIVLIAIALNAASCAYDDSYLDAKLPKNMAYFASLKEYHRTLVVGEGLRFKIGAAMAGELNNNADRTVNFKLGSAVAFPFEDLVHVPLQTDYYNYNTLTGSSGLVQATIPKGLFIGYFTVVMDSVKFLNHPLAMLSASQTKFLTLPVKIVSTSLDSVNKANDSITIKVRYMAGTDGYYLYKNTITKKLNGNTVGTTITENYASESDEQAWRLTTAGPFTVEVASAIAEKTTSGLKFNLTVVPSGISYQSIAGQAVVEANGPSTYDKTTRDFILNYTYKKAGNDTVYHVNSNLIFRNRMRDGINETREYLNKL